MRRREFLTIIGAPVLARPLDAFAQGAGKLPTIGFLGPATAAVAAERIAAFEDRLRDLGWDHRTVVVEYKWAEGRPERFHELATELARQEVDVIVTWGTATAVAVQQVTSVIPVVFTIVGDPVGSGLVDSLARPGGNMTGLSTQHAEAAGKRVELLIELVPQLRRLAIMANDQNSGGLLELQQANAAARKLGLDVTTVPVRGVAEIEEGFEALQGRADALYVAGDALFNNHRTRVNALCLAARLPAIHGFREIVAGGGLMSYGPEYLDLFRRAADYVDKVLRGARPSGIPVEQPTKFELVINVVTARALGLTIPPMLLARADEVIE